MSLCISIMNENELYMSGDSRVSMTVGDKTLKIHDNCNKIVKIGNYVIFKSGREDVVNNIEERFRNSYLKDIYTLQQICVNEFIKFKKMLTQEQFKQYEEDSLTIAISVGTVENGKVVQYFLTEQNNFEIKRYVYNPYDYAANVKFVGCRIPEAIAEFKKCRFNNNNRNTMENYRRIYENVSNEEVGGKLTLYRITANGIEKFECDINDKNKIETLEEYKAKINNRDRVMILQGSIISNNMFSFNELFGLKRHYRAKDFQDLNGNSLIKADSSTGKLSFDSTYQVDGGLYSKALVVSQDKSTANSIFIGDFEGDTTTDNAKNESEDPYSIRFVDGNDVKGRLWYKQESEAIKLLAKNNISLECGSGNTVYIGKDDGDFNSWGGTVIDFQQGIVTKMLIDDNVQIFKDNSTDSISLKSYIKNNGGGNSITSATIKSSNLEIVDANNTVADWTITRDGAGKIQELSNGTKTITINS